MIVKSAPGYELLDFGAGRKLERFGDMLVDRPAPQALNEPARRGWQADWYYDGSRVADGQWLAGSAGKSGHWLADIDGQLMHCRLGKGGQVGVYPEHIACWRWLTRQLEAAGPAEPRVLNLFAGTGGASLAAMRAGAQVTHVDAQASQLELARQNCGEQGVRYIKEHVVSYVERLLRQGERFHMIIMDPPSFGRGGKKKVWDIRADLEPLLGHLPGLLADDCRGVWLSLHTQEMQDRDIAALLGQVLPGMPAKTLQMGTQTSSGRVLEAGVAAVWSANI